MGPIPRTPRSWPRAGRPATATAGRRALPLLVLGAALGGGCASAYDAGRVRERTASLYPAPARPEPAEARSAEQRADLAELLAASDLAGLVARGLESSADLRAAYEDWLASTERVRQESTLPEPRLSYVELLEEIQTRTGPQERRLGLSQAFPWPGRLDAQARLAERRAEAAWQRVEVVRLEVRERIEVAYQDYAFLGRELGITRRLLDLLRGLEPVVQGRIRAGAGQEDLLRLQVEIGRLEDDLSSVERRRPAVAARIADAMTIRADLGELPFPEEAEPRPDPVEVAEALERVRRDNPRLEAARREHAAGRAAQELAEYQGRPGFSVGFDYLQTGDAPNPATPGSGDDPLLVSLSVSLPVWASSYDAAEREARHRLRAASERVDRTESSLRAELEEQAYRVDDAARRIALYRDSLIPRAEEALQLTLTSYRSGSSSVLDLIDSERALLEFQLSYWRACRDYLQGAARLRALTGEDLG